ncbi:CRM-domain containing factor CFM2, chloroplastic isoform X2 [Cryptomeria japonica]|uniref:CRM-domain containing factor CFM2, chloroplastic isoform X2 n=1 Tax=Cryptomeria japonica TaxID=3369 RepID=UPI0027DA5E38|nr:CRM-domain containing factor CFM2, chloroplastic isoform X2 [Cryptomeria japonica]
MAIMAKLAVSGSALAMGSLYNSLQSSEIHGTHLQLPLNSCKKPKFQRLNCRASNSTQDDDESDNSSNGIGKIALQRIAEKLRNLERGNEIKEVGFELNHGSSRRKNDFLSRPKHKIGHSFVRSRSSSIHMKPMPKQGELKTEEEGEVISEKKKPDFVPTLAQLSIPGQQLKRLRTLGKYSDKKVTIGKDGISEAVINYIHHQWKNSEVVKIKCGGMSVNMKKNQDILEKETGGLVVWRARDTIILYRGVNYKHPFAEPSPIIGVDLQSVDDIQFASTRNLLSTSVGRMNGSLPLHTSSECEKTDLVNDKGIDSLVNSDTEVNQTDFIYAPNEQRWEGKCDSQLDGLTTHFTDCSAYGSSQADSVLLPAIVPQHLKPARILPSGIEDKLTETKMSSLQELAESIPPNFSLDKNCQPQELAAAIFELWERSEIAKIAVKCGVQSQNNISEKMVEEIMGLTGGTLLSRNNEFIVLYRGKDFHSFDAASVLTERKATSLLTKKIKRKKRQESSSVLAERELQFNVSGTVAQNKGRKKQWKRRRHSEDQKQMQKGAYKAKLSLDSKLDHASSKKVEVENELHALEWDLKCVEPPANRETITIEERLVLRKIGLRMNAFILLGKPGIFDDIIENIHLHWKYRKLVKIISKENSFVQVKDLARILEYESGGILVAVDSVEKGYAIILYHGKTYQRPTMLRPDSLLSKKVALRRWNRIQRRESLRLELLRVERDIERLKFHLGQHLEASLDLYDSSNKNEDDRAAFQVVKTATNLGKAMIRTAEHNKKEKTSNEVYRAEPLSNKDRRLLRELAKKMPKHPQFCVGKKNVVSDLAKSIRSRFKKHSLVKVEVKDRAKGTSISEIAFQLEEATGSLLVHREPGKVVLYRGWPDGQKKPSYDK